MDRLSVGVDDGDSDRVHCLALLDLEGISGKTAAAWNAMALDTYDWLKIAASSAVIGSAMGAIINGLFARGKDRRERDRESFLAALLAVDELEGYMRACAQMIYIDSEAQQEAGRYGNYKPLDRVRLPVFSYPTEIQWKWLPKDIAAQLREFPNAHQETAQYIRNNAEFDDPFSACDEVTLGCAQLGEHAWKLAATVRERWGAPGRAGASARRKRTANAKGARSAA